MSDYTTSYGIRYSIPSIQQQIEYALVSATIAIKNEDPSTPNYANRQNWAAWTLRNSAVAWTYFGWLVASNATILAAVKNDPTGASVQDSDIQFVVNSSIDNFISDWQAGIATWPNA